MASEVNPAIGKVLYTKEQIDKRLDEIAAAIDKEYEGKQLVLVGILKGAFIFLSDLCRKIKVQHTVEFMAVSSYGASTTSSGSVRIIMDCRQDLSNKHVLIVEDIVDTGLTLQFLINTLKSKQPESIECCTFLRKVGCLKVPEIPLKFVGFDVDPVFVVGYGLDYAERFRTLPYVGVLKEEVYKKK